MPTALVTGASSGIGAAFARRLASDGYELVLVARNESRLTAGRLDLLKIGAPAVEVLTADLTDAGQRDAVCARLADAKKPVSLLVSNAGMALGKGFLASTAAELQAQLDLNVSAVMMLTHAALPGMIARGHGGIITISSIASMLPGRGSAYGAFKSWVTAFSEGIGMSVRSKGIRMVAVCPGFVRTEFHERAGIDMQGNPEWMFVPMDVLVGQSLAGLRAGKSVVIPGALYKTIAAAVKFAPRSLVRRATNLVDGRTRD
ncbi:MAG: SDR family NAD(P)-dependent oxidoreductase [Nakamurella sp.]